MQTQYSPDTARWPAVTALVAAGMVSGLQVGKAAIAVFCRTFAGSIVSMLEPRRSPAAGLAERVTFPNYMPLTMLSVIFLASPSSIIVLSR